MLYIILGLTGLLILVALFTYLSRRKKNEPEEEIVAPPSDCCGAHAVCEKGLKKADSTIEYFEDEDLDRFKLIPPDGYTDDQIDAFREVLYTLRPEEITDWLISLEKREIYLPYILRQEAIDMCP